MTATLIFRVRTLWTVPLGGSGFASLYFDADNATATAPADLTAAVYNFFNSVRGQLAPGISMVQESEVATVRVSDGVNTQFSPVTPNAPIASNGTGNYAGASGCVVQWRTAQVIGSRRLRGRTFLVPLAGAALDTNGTIQSSSITSITTAAVALINASAAAGPNAPMVVWSRPIKAGNPGGYPPRSGTAYTVIGASVPDKSAVLRSRRD